MKSRVALLAGLFLTCAAFAQELTDPVPILIPIHVGGHLPGAFGSAWATNVHVFNSSPGGVVYFGGGCNLGVICPTFRTVTSLTSYPLTIYRGNPGYLLWVSRGDERNVHVAARLFETTRNAIPGGVAIPVAKDQDFRESIAIASVPKRDGQRYHLRVYGIPHQVAPLSDSYVVTVTSWTGAVIEEKEIAAHTGAPYHWGGAGPTPFPVLPIFGWAPLDEALAQAPDASVAIKVRSLSGSRLWAFVAITDNDSQAVSLALPN